MPGWLSDCRRWGQLPILNGNTPQYVCAEILQSTMALRGVAPDGSTEVNGFTNFLVIATLGTIVLNPFKVPVSSSALDWR